MRFKKRPVSTTTEGLLERRVESTPLVELQWFTQDRSTIGEMNTGAPCGAPGAPSSVANVVDEAVELGHTFRKVGVPSAPHFVNVGLFWRGLCLFSAQNLGEPVVRLQDVEVYLFADRAVELAPVNFYKTRLRQHRREALQRFIGEPVYVDAPLVQHLLEHPGHVDGPGAEQLRGMVHIKKGHASSFLGDGTLIASIPPYGVSP